MSMPPEIHINLVERDTGRQQAVAEMLIIAFLTAILAVIMLVFYFNQVERISLERKENVQLKQELLKYGPSQAAMTLNKNIEKQLADKSRLVNNLKLQGMPATKILDDIEKSMPEGARLINLGVADSKVMVKGYTNDFTSTARLVASLKQSPYFDDIAVLNVQREEDSGEVVFNIEMVWKGGKK